MKRWIHASNEKGVVDSCRDSQGSQTQPVMESSEYDQLTETHKQPNGEDRLRAEWYTAESYPDVDAEQLAAVQEIDWGDVTAEDTENLLYDLDLTKIKSIRYCNADEETAVKQEGFEDGYVVTFKDGRSTVFAWRAYPNNLDKLTELPDALGHSRYYKSKKQNPFAHAMADYNEQIADEAYGRR